MIKAVGTFDSREVLLLGLSRENFERLLRKEPIFLAIEDVGLSYPLDLLIVAGETEAGITHDLQHLIGDETEIVIVARKGRS